MTAVLAIDQGTSGTKAIVVDPADGVLSAVEIPVRPSYLADGRVEQDPEDLFDSVIQAGALALEQSGREVGSVALANQGETVLAWDPASGRPLSTAIVWQDGRAAGICDELATHRDLLARRTGLVLDPYFSAPKMAWLRRSGIRTGVVSTTDTWLLHRLTGEFVTDAATASRSLLLDLDTGAWDRDLLQLFGLEQESLPRIVGCDEIIGTTDAFGSRLVVGGQILDQPAALLAQGCLVPGATKVTFGTGAFLLANTGDARPRSTCGLTTSVGWSLRGRRESCIDGQVFTVASAVRWLIGLGLVSSPQELDAIAEPESGGVLCVPAFAGLGAPWWRSDATASFTGIGLDTAAGHLVTAVLQGIAAQVAELTRLLAIDLGSPLTVLKADGGLSGSSALMQSVANLTGLPVQVYPSAHATALGAAAVGRLAAEPGLSISDAVPDVGPAVGYMPRWSADRSDDHLQRWKHAVQAALPVREGSR